MLFRLCLYHRSWLIFWRYVRYFEFGFVVSEYMEHAHCLTGTQTIPKTMKRAVFQNLFKKSCLTKQCAACTWKCRRAHRGAQRPKKPRRPSSSAHLPIFLRRSLTEHGAAVYMSPPNSPVSAPCMTEVTRHVRPCPTVYRGPGELNSGPPSGPHAYGKHS